MELIKINVIAITGYSCSGKSTIVNQLEQIYNCDIIKFGSIHKLCVKDSGYEYAKDWIREKGFDTYEKSLVKTFITTLQGIITDNKILIIDGIFSDKCFQYMKKCKNINLINIVIDTNYSNRLNRMMKRENLDIDSAEKHLQTTDKIKEQAGLNYILRQPTYLVDGNADIESIEQECFRILASISMNIENMHYINNSIKNDDRWGTK